MQAFEYVSAGSVIEVADLLTSNNGDARVLCGGTDLLVQLRENRRKAELLIDVKNIPELTAIHYDPQAGLWLGAAASCYAICQHRVVLEHYPGLVDAIRLIGGVQIQYRASVGGNLCNASPAGDSIPSLIVHEGTCIIANRSGTRALPVEQFCVAPGKISCNLGRSWSQSASHRSEKILARIICDLSRATKWILRWLAQGRPSRWTTRKEEFCQPGSHWRRSHQPRSSWKKQERS